AATARASRSNRSENLASETLMATMRSTRVAQALKTSPMPPRTNQREDLIRPSLASGKSSIGDSASVIDQRQMIGCSAAPAPIDRVMPVDPIAHGAGGIPRDRR